MQTTTLGRLAAVLLLVGLPHQARAQDETLEDALTGLVTARAVDIGSFPRDPDAAAVTSETLASAVRLAVSSAPVGTSAHGITYTFDPRLGVPVRDAQTFGSWLLERPLTARVGEGTWGVSYRYMRFQALNGNDLRGGGFVTAAHRLSGAPQAFDEERLTMRLDMSSETVFANYGLAERVEIGAALPLVTVRLEGQRLEYFDGVAVQQAQVSTSDTGLGDLALRVKHHFLGTHDSGLAGLLQVRLPTGDADNFRGAGAASLEFGIVGATDVGRATIYANASRTVGGLAGETRLGGGAAVAVAPRLTASAELLFRSFHDLQRSIAVAALHPSLGGVETNRVERAGDPLRTVDAATGVRWSIAGTWMLSGQVLWSLNDAGLRATWTPVVSLDYGF